MKKTIYALVIIIGIIALAIGMSFSNNGRYALQMNPIVRADQYMIDTKTGRIWQIVKDDNGSLCLQHIPYIEYSDGNKEYSLNPTY